MSVKAPQFCVKVSPRNTEEPCAVCGTTFRWTPGPDVYVEGSWLLVCHNCAANHAPHLFEILAAIGRYPDSRLLTRNRFDDADEETQSFTVR